MSGRTNWLAFGCAALVLLDAFFIPDIRISSRLPAFQLTDFLLPIIGLLLYPKLPLVRKEWWFLWIALFAGYMLLPILINGRIKQWNDYLELYRVLKLGVIFLLFRFIQPKQLHPLIVGSFMVLLLINVLHLYNVFNINELLTYTYGDSIHFKLFGRDSSGNPAVKRMLGTMGNPNANALLFLFFTVYFLPIEKKREHWALCYTALFMVFLCQSRTSLIAVGLVVGAMLFLTKNDGLKAAVWKVVSTIGLYVLATMIATSFFKYSSYSNSLMDGSALYSTSLRSRWESWNILWDMIKTKPIFGFGPYKAYFTAHQLYSENEYLLIWWRYGIFGLLFYLGIFLLPFWEMFRRKFDTHAGKAMIMIGVMLIAALTNNPLTERSISVLFIFLLASGLPKSKEHEKTLAHW
jgi:O-antigen ligase